MFKFIAVFAVVAVASAHYVPAAYHTVAYHPVAIVKHEPKVEPWGHAEKSEWEPKVVEWKHGPKVVQWKEEEKSWEHKEEEKPANYDFKYEVHDEKTGDIKRQSETASNGVVQGQYSLIDADGFRRVVDYTADDHHGFQATVMREPLHHVHKVIQPVIVKKIEAHHVVAHAPQWW